MTDRPTLGPIPEEAAKHALEAPMRAAEVTEAEVREALGQDDGDTRPLSAGDIQVGVRRHVMARQKAERAASIAEASAIAERSARPVTPTGNHNPGGFFESLTNLGAFFAAVHQILHVLREIFDVLHPDKPNPNPELPPAPPAPDTPATPEAPEEGE